MFSFRRFFKLGSIGYLVLGTRVYRKVLEGRCPAHAAAIAYYVLFAVFPFLLFLTTVIGHLHIPGLLEHVLRRAERMLPDQIFYLVQDSIRALFSPNKHGLLPLGLLLSLWGASNAVVCFMDAINNLYGVKEGRSFWRVRLTAVLLVIVLTVLFLLSLTLLMFGRRIGHFIVQTTSLDDPFFIFWKVMLIPMVLVLLTLAVALIYYYAPDVKQQRKWVTPGSLVAVPSWIVASLGFSYYLNSFSSYDRTSGILGAVIALLLWLYISGLVILVGAVINSVLEHASQEGKDPGEKIAGARGQKSWWSRLRKGRAG